MRRRRTDASVELRKAKKEEKLTKRRNLTNLDDEPTSPLSESTNKVSTSPLSESTNKVRTSPLSEYQQGKHKSIIREYQQGKHKSIIREYQQGKHKFFKAKSSFRPKDIQS